MSSDYKYPSAAERNDTYYRVNTTEELFWHGPAHTYAVNEDGTVTIHEYVDVSNNPLPRLVQSASYAKGFWLSVAKISKSEYEEATGSRA